MCPWTWARAAAASTWGRPRCASPAYRRASSSLGTRCEDIGNISVKQAEEMPYGEKRAKYMAEIAETCKDLAEIVQKSLEDGFVPLVLGGDHSIAAGAVTGVAAHFRKAKKQIGYIWLDAHGDMNTPESSPSGNVHGMPLAAVMGYGAPELVDLLGFKPKVEPQNIVLVGVRDLDTQERRLVKKSGVRVFTMRDIDERGMREVMADALKYATDDTDGISVSLDMDFVDPSDAPGRRHACARRRHLSRSAPGHGNDRRQRRHGLDGNRGNQSGHRRTQPHRAARRGADPLRPGPENPVEADLMLDFRRERVFYANAPPAPSGNSI